MRISFASKISGLEVSSRSRTNSPSLDLENFFKSWSRVLDSNFFQVLVSVSNIRVLTTSLLHGGSAPRSPKQHLHCRFLAPVCTEIMHYAVSFILRWLTNVIITKDGSTVRYASDFAKKYGGLFL